VYTRRNVSIIETAQKGVVIIEMNIRLNGGILEWNSGRNVGIVEIASNIRKVVEIIVVNIRMSGGILRGIL
jgi:hypothetical protein